MVAFIEALARSGVHEGLREEARQALEEWWVPNARHRPTAGEIVARRAAPVSYHVVGGGPWRLSLPTTFTGTGLRHVPEEARSVESWHGHLCGDARTVVFVNMKLPSFASKKFGSGPWKSDAMPAMSLSPSPSKSDTAVCCGADVFTRAACANAPFPVLRMMST